MKPVVAVIPARLGSSRFPRKILHPYRNQPLIRYVWANVGRARKVDKVLIATDSAEIRQAAESFGAEVIMTSRRHRTGSDRVAEAVKALSPRLVINVQGDCFGLKGAALDRGIEAMTAERTIHYATLAYRITSDRDLADPGLVKLVVDNLGNARWFSRAPLPYLQSPTPGARTRQARFLGHIGVYFFRPAALRAFAGWERTPNERAESLEQLRILEHGGDIRVFVTRKKMISIDKPADLKKIAAI